MRRRTRVEVNLIMFSLSLPIPLLHASGPVPTGPTYSHWVLEPTIAAFIFGLTALYLAWVGPLNRRRPGVELRPVRSDEVRWFLVGSVLAIVALGPPLDDWGGFFFISAHMAQHLILMFAVVPCWLYGIPSWVYEPVTRITWLSRVMRFLLSTIPAFIIGNALMIGWHLPIVYNAAVNSDVIHSIQHQSFLVVGLFFWWPLMSKVREWPRLSTPLDCLYLFAQTIPGGILGAFLVYASPETYSAYTNVRPWGVTADIDMEVAGLLMWVGMNGVFLGLLTFRFLRWATREEREDRMRQQRRPARAVASPATTDVAR